MPVFSAESLQTERQPCDHFSVQNDGTRPFAPIPSAAEYSNQLLMVLNTCISKRVTRGLLSGPEDCTCAAHLTSFGPTFFLHRVELIYSLVLLGPGPGQVAMRENQGCHRPKLPFAALWPLLPVPLPPLPVLSPDRMWALGTTRLCSGSPGNTAGLQLYAIYGEACSILGLLPHGSGCSLVSLCTDSWSCMEQLHLDGKNA